MKKIYLWILILLLITACAQTQNNANSENNGNESTERSDDTTSAETVPPDCYGTDFHPIGQSIADQYESVSYTQVMIWFCNGAEFEDIAQALLTQELTDEDAEKLLEMIAGGQTWDEIWLAIGLTEE
jgi:hypothetical protein